jgi:hypothetical protein
MPTSDEILAARLAEGLTFEKVWASLMELREFQGETDRQMKRMDAKIDRILQENAQRTKKRDNTDWYIEPSDDVIEPRGLPNLAAKFKELGFTFTCTASHLEITNEEHNIFVTFGTVLQNDDTIMPVSEGYPPDRAGINDLIERIEKLRRHAGLNNDHRKHLGAIAGKVFEDDVKRYALENGLFVIEPSGETFIITPPQNPPRER